MKKTLLLYTLLSLGCIFFVSAQQKNKLTPPDFHPPIALSDSINSEVEEIQPIISHDGNTLYFIRSQSQANKGGYLAGQDIWISQKDEEGNWSSPTNDTIWNNKKNNGVIGISQDQNRVYMLNSYRSLRRQGKSIAYVFFENGEWQRPTTLNFKQLKAKKTFYGFFMHPDEDVLLISMVGHDTYGQEDLYVSLRQNDSTWSEPLNLGKLLNTDCFEISPFLDDDKKTLYFTSDRPGGCGNADIYMTKRLDNSWTKWSIPVNLKSLNTEHFDGYFILTDFKEAIFASNRNGGFTDLFYSREIIPTDQLAKAIERTGLAEDTVERNPLLSYGHDQIVAHLIEQDNDLAQLFSKDFVFFNFDSYQLRPEAKDLLKRFADLLSQYGNTRLVLTGHTDSVGDPVYNLKLSQKRANSVREYLIEAGLTSNSISASGRGEDDPMADNDSEEGRQQNRRVSIFIDRND